MLEKLNAFQFSSSAKQSQDRFTSHDFSLEVVSQDRAQVQSAYIGTTNDSDIVTLIRVEVDFGFRLVEPRKLERVNEMRKSRDSVVEDVSDLESNMVVAVIEAKYVVDYQVTQKLTVADFVESTKLDSYIHENSIEDAWPHWLEFLVGQIVRMGLPKKTIPNRVGSIQPAERRGVRDLHPNSGSKRKKKLTKKKVRKRESN